MPRVIREEETIVYSGSIIKTRVYVLCFLYIETKRNILIFRINFHCVKSQVMLLVAPSKLLFQILSHVKMTRVLHIRCLSVMIIYNTLVSRYVLIYIYIYSIYMCVCVCVTIFSDLSKSRALCGDHQKGF